MRVLVVDDNALIRKMIRAVLDEEGVECHEAADVASALSALRDLKPDLCFLDQYMPDGEGFSVLKALQAWPQGNRPRVYLLTGSADESIASQARQLGATGVLFKPVDPNLLIQKVRER